MFFFLFWVVLNFLSLSRWRTFHYVALLQVLCVIFLVKCRSVAGQTMVSSGFPGYVQDVAEEDGSDGITPSLRPFPAVHLQWIPVDSVDLLTRANLFSSLFLPNMILQSTLDFRDTTNPSLAIYVSPSADASIMWTPTVLNSALYETATEQNTESLVSVSAYGTSNIFLDPNASRFPIFLPSLTITAYPTAIAYFGMTPYFSSNSAWIIGASSALSVNNKQSSPQTASFGNAWQNRSTTFYSFQTTSSSPPVIASYPETILLKTVLRVDNSSTEVNRKYFMDVISGRLVQLYDQAGLRYANQQLSKNVSGFSTPPNIVGVNSYSTSVDIANVIWNKIADVVTIIFAVKTQNGTVPASQVLNKLDVFTVPEIASILKSPVVERPSAYVWPSEDSNKLSWPLLAAIVAVSTVMVVLVSLAIVWLILFIYVKCTRKNSKTSPSSIPPGNSLSANNRTSTGTGSGIIIHSDGLVSELRQDVSVQTLVLPRRTRYNNLSPNQYKYGTEENHTTSKELVSDTTTVVRERSYVRRDRTPAHVEEELRSPSPIELTISNPVKNSIPRQINEMIHSARKIAMGRRSSVIVPVESQQLTNGRVKLVSVVKTNRMPSDRRNPGNYGQAADTSFNSPCSQENGNFVDNNHQPSNWNNPRYVRSPSSNILNRNGRHGQYNDTVRRIRKEVQLWQKDQEYTSPRDS